MSLTSYRAAPPREGQMSDIRDQMSEAGRKGGSGPRWEASREGRISEIGCQMSDSPRASPRGASMSERAGAPRPGPGGRMTEVASDI
jgi:hypothetical protein